MECSPHRPSSSVLAPFVHQVRNALCVVFANERIDVGTEDVTCEEVAPAVALLQRVFGTDLGCSKVRVHLNKTAANMLDFAREARLDRKDALFVFFLGPIANGWIVGCDGIAAPLQDLLQMFGCSSEECPTFFCALHLPLPEGRLFRDPTSPSQQIVLHRHVSLFKHQAYMWMRAPASLEDFLRLLTLNAATKDLGLIMNKFAELTRRIGDSRCLQIQQTFGRLVYLTGD